MRFELDQRTADTQPVVSRHVRVAHTSLVLPYWSPKGSDNPFCSVCCCLGNSECTTDTTATALMMLMLMQFWVIKPIKLWSAFSDIYKCEFQIYCGTHSQPKLQKPTSCVTTVRVIASIHNRQTDTLLLAHTIMQSAPVAGRGAAGSSTPNKHCATTEPLAAAAAAALPGSTT